MEERPLAKSNVPMVPWATRYWNNRFLFLLLIPGLIFFLVFKYLPIYGLIIAFNVLPMTPGPGNGRM